MIRTVRHNVTLIGLVALLMLNGGAGRAVHPELPAAEDTTTALKAPSQSRQESIRMVPAMGMVLLIVFLLTLLFFLATYIFIRTSRRARSLVLRDPPPQTTADDLWAKHKLQDKDDEDQPRSTNSST